MAILAHMRTEAVAWYQVENGIITWLPIVFMGLLVFFIWRTMRLMPRTKPQQIEPESASSIAWKDVAGADEAKAELAEVVEFLRDPERFRALGAKVPKGILLHGPPGTGKTLLAKAVAGESGAQFFSQSAAAFVEMFAGLGAARIRRLFAEARNARARRSSSSTRSTRSAAQRGSDQNSEREQTLNQLLVEMDGFGSTGDLVVIAASNLLEKLDPALLRPGPLRPPGLRLAARRRRAARRSSRVHCREQAAARRRRPRRDRAPDRRPHRRRPGQHLQRGGDRRRPRAPQRARARPTSTPRWSA